MKKDDDKYFEIYLDLCQLLGEQNMMKIYSQYKGLSIQFPKGLYSKKYIKRYVEENFDKKSVREISTELNLTERRVRQIFREIKLDEGKNENGK